jgi:cancer susceptibility candidate protein 1
VQLNFDPFAVLLDENIGHEFYALGCIIILESLQAAERPRRVGEWTSRADPAGGPNALTRNEYPPQIKDEDMGRRTVGAAVLRGGASDNDLMKVTFEAPDNVVIRTRQPMVGQWKPLQRLWDPTSTGRVGTDHMNRRVVSFLTSELTVMGLVQKKGFDMPYERWGLEPCGDDQVMVTIEGCHHDDLAAGRTSEMKILVQGSKCRLIAPEDRELSHIRAQWLHPLTLLRQMAAAGYNLLLSDKDAEYLPSIVPRTKALELRAYFDMSLLCETHAFASSRHNRTVEEADAGLFRCSKQQRDLESGRPWSVDPEDHGRWHAVRYDTTRVALAQFTEVEDLPTLAVTHGQEPHVNLFTALQHVYGAEAIADRVTTGSQLLQDAVLHLLLLVRPLTWG